MLVCLSLWLVDFYQPHDVEWGQVCEQLFEKGRRIRHVEKKTFFSVGVEYLITNLQLKARL